MTPQFRSKVLAWGPRLAEELALEPHQVAGLFGNFAAETDQFRALQEYKPVVKGSAGGFGWVQWTGPRRRAYEQWCREASVDPSSDDANFRYVVVELRGSEKRALAALRRTKSADAAAESVMRRYERPGVEHLDARKRFAREALDLLAPKPTAQPAVTVWPVADPVPVPKAPSPASRQTILLVQQQRLLSLGYSMVGKPDGLDGPRTSAAVAAFQQVNGLAVDGKLGPKTDALLRGPGAKPMVVSSVRALASVADVKPLSDIIKRADGKLVRPGLAAAIGLPSLTGALDFWSSYSSTIAQVKEFFVQVPGWLWVGLAAAVLLFVVWQARKIIEARVAQHRVGGLG